MNILVIDDEALIAEGICHIISKMDIASDVLDYALSAESALEKMKEKKYHFCFVDINMPKIDGLELIRICQERQLCKYYCIISGYAEFEYARKAIRLGVKDYLLKPVDKKALLEILQRFDLSYEIRKSFKGNNPHVKQMLHIIQTSYAKNVTLSDVAESIGINVNHAGRLFKTSTGYSFNDYVNRYKLNCIIKDFKEDSDLSFEQLAEKHGFSEIRTFYRVFKKIFNMTPGEYRDKVKCL